MFHVDGYVSEIHYEAWGSFMFLWCFFVSVLSLHISENDVIKFSLDNVKSGQKVQGETVLPRVLPKASCVSLGVKVRFLLRFGCLFSYKYWPSIGFFIHVAVSSSQNWFIVNIVSRQFHKCSSGSHFEKVKVLYLTQWSKIIWKIRSLFSDLHNRQHSFLCHPWKC